MTLSRKKKWQEQEKKIAAKLEGKRTKQSGGGYTKGDVISKEFMIECKTTKFKSFSITRRLLDKLDEDSFGSDKIICICVQIEDGERTFYVLPDYSFEVLANVYKREFESALKST